MQVRVLGLDEYESKISLMEAIETNLEGGEHTPDWDSQKLRGHIIALHSTELHMSREDRDRYMALVIRLRTRMHQLSPDIVVQP